MKKTFALFLTMALLLCSQSCGLMKMYNMANCDYSFQRLTGISWAGIDFMKKGFDYGSLDLGTVAKCTKAIVNKDFTINFNIELKATNPGRREAEIAGFDYILYYANEKVGDGVSMNKSNIVVPAKGGSTIIPVSFRLDLKDLVDVKHPVQSGEKVVNIIGDISKVGNGNTPFVVKVRPHIRVHGEIVKGPYFTIRDN